MSEAALFIRHPFLLIEGLKIAAEVTRAGMNGMQNDRLIRIVEKLEQVGTTALLSTDQNTLEDLIHCLRLFRQSRTWHWLRTDLSDSLSDFERAIRKAQLVK
ncbi:MAG: hypothetical protein K0R28_48 [Paenibacillus sp.]|nr:hypothetical protein [Paenibacillus sp.]